MIQNIAMRLFKDYQVELYEQVEQSIQMRQLSIFEHINDSQIQTYWEVDTTKHRQLHKQFEHSRDTQEITEIYGESQNECKNYILNCVLWRYTKQQMHKVPFDNDLFDEVQHRHREQQRMTNQWHIEQLQQHNVWNSYE